MIPLRRVGPIALWLAFLLLFAAGPGLCGQAPVLPRHAFDLSLVGRYFSYEEPGPDIDIEGFLYGVSGSYAYHNLIFLELELDLSYGELDYDGRTFGGTPVRADTRDWLLEGRYLFGLDIPVDSRNLLTAFSGIALRYWNDEIRSSGGYEREISYWYLPLGGTWQARLSRKWLLSLSGEYDLFLDGTVRSHLSDVNPAYNDPENDQDDGYGWKASIRGSRSIGDLTAFIVEAFVSSWHIEDSEPDLWTFGGAPIGLVYEPENETLTFGLRLGWQF